jgi:hypothetical protein
MYSRSLDNSCALNKDPRIIREYFGIPKGVTAEFKSSRSKPENIYKTDEKGFLLGLIQRPVRIVVNSSDKTAILRQPGQQEEITVINWIGPGLEDRGLWGSASPVKEGQGEERLYA